MFELGGYCIGGSARGAGSSGSRSASGSGGNQ